MTTLTVPDYDALILVDQTLDIPQQGTRSEWTSRSKVIGTAGTELWRFKLALEPIATELEERPWRAFWFGLMGRINNFNLLMPQQRHIGPRPTVDSGASNGYSLPLTGMQASARILSAGQYLTVPLPSGHKRLAMLVADLVTDSSGEAVASLNVALNETPTGGVTVETGDPYCPVSLSQSATGFSYDNAVAGFAFDVEESL